MIKSKNPKCFFSAYNFKGGNFTLLGDRDEKEKNRGQPLGKASGCGARISHQSENSSVMVPPGHSSLSEIWPQTLVDRRGEIQ